MQTHKYITLIAAAVATLFCGPASRAEKTDPSLIPPDVTLTSVTPSTATPAASATTAPGVSAPGVTPGAAAQPPAPGLAGQALQSAHGIAPMTLNGYAIPNTGKVSATMMKAPGTQFGMTGNGQPSQPAQTQEQPAGLYKGSGAPLDPTAPDPEVVITTSKGNIRIRLFRKYAPITVDNFMDLVRRGFYNGLKFHRVEPGFCIQGGCPNGTGTGIFIDPDTHQARMLPLETTTNLKHNAAGVVAMARMQSPNSGSCQFYITLSAQPNLDMHYAVFGGVVSGLDVAQKIEKGDVITSAALVQ